MKQTKAYRAALTQLADAVAQQDPAEVRFGMRGGEIGIDLSDVLKRRHSDFYAAMERAFEEHIQRRKQQAIERRRATLAKRKADTKGGNRVAIR